MTTYSVQVCALFERCDAAGLSVELLVDGNLLITPAANLTDELRAEIRKYKSEIIKRIYPYVNEANGLVIPGRAPVRFHWWQDGQSTVETLRELNAPIELLERHLPAPIIPHKGAATIRRAFEKRRK